jgi:hypothetical protein
MEMGSRRLCNRRVVKLLTASGKLNESENVNVLPQTKQNRMYYETFETAMHFPMSFVSLVE